jgi:DNA-binding XRE family transcriptional regulator
MLESAELRARRAVEKISQATFAKVLGISRERLIAIERDETRPDGKIEEAYNKLYNGQRLINISFERGADCPFCTEVGRRVWHDEKNPERDIYECVKCDRVYRARDSWHLTEEDWLRISKKQKK